MPPYFPDLSPALPAYFPDVPSGSVVWTETARNEVRHPEANLIYWPGAPVNTTRSIETVGGPVINGYPVSWLKLVTTAPLTPSNMFFNTDFTGGGAYVNFMPVTPGLTVYYGMQCISSYTGFPFVRSNVNWLDSSGASISASSALGTLALPDTWYNFSASAVTPPGASYAFVYFVFGDGSAAPVGTYFGMSAPYISRTPINFFSGNTVPSGFTRYRYLGAANDSFSVREVGTVV